MKHPDRLTYTYGPNDYTLYYCGKSIGGAGTAPGTHKRRNGAMLKADLRLFEESAKRERDALLAGQGQQRMREAIELIDSQEMTP